MSGCLTRDVDEGLQRRAGNFLGAMETLCLGHGGSGYTTAALAEFLSYVTDLNKSGLEISNKEQGQVRGGGWERVDGLWSQAWTFYSLSFHFFTCNVKVASFTVM